MSPKRDRGLRPPPGEDLKTEFKGASVLDPARDPRFTDVLRSVSAMWNAEGGSILVGVEDDGTVTGLRTEDLARLDALRDAILDSMEPRVAIDKDVRLEVHQVGHAAVLRIRVRPDRRKGPACLTEGATKRVFWKRSGNRTRPMTRGELEEAFRRQAESPGKDLSKDRSREQELVDALDDFSRAHRPVFALGAAFLDLGAALDLESGEIRRFLQEPDAHAIRPGGWTYLSGFPGDPRRSGTRPSCLETGSSKDLYRHLCLTEDGMLLFRTEVMALAGEAPPFVKDRWPDMKGVLSGYALAETTRSICWLLGRIGRLRSLSGPVVQQARLDGTGWVLAAVGPDRFGCLQEVLWRPPCPSVPAIVSKPRQVRLARLADSPADVATQLLEDVFWDFGHGPEAVPVFDPARGTFSYRAAPAAPSRSGRP